jgi:hypothetical protein
MPRIRTTLAALALLVTAVGCSPEAPDSAPGPPLAPAPAAAAPSPLALLHAWDRRRAAAWALGDARALRALYVTGSAAGARDLAMLRAWSSRGLTVASLEVQVLAGEVVARRPGRVTFEVTERLARAEARAGTRTWLLPRGQAGTRRVAMWRVAGRWRVASVSAG